MPKDALARFFAGSTEMAKRHRAFDWSSTSLGPPNGWREHLRALVRIMLDSNQPMFIVWGEERTLLYNDTYAELLGNKHPQALGQDFLKVWQEIRDDLEPIVNRAYRGEPVQMNDIELWMLRRGYLEETHFQFFYAPVRGDEGIVFGFMAACTEITGQVMAERRLAMSEARHRGILANMDEGFVLFDRDFKILEINDATPQLVGLSREELIGHNHWERFPGTKESELGSLYQRVLATQHKESCEFAYRYPDGRERWYEIRAFPVQDCLAVIFRDITDQRKILETLKLADRRKDEFLAMLAHELRNPLAPIRSAAELLMMDNISGAQVRQSSVVISRQVRHMTSLVDDLLDVSRVTRGLATLRLEEVDLAKVVSDAVEQVRHLLSSKAHQLSIHLASAPAMVLGDSKRLVQIFGNLLNNAAKYTQAGGRIAVHVETPDPGQVSMSVQDNGIGMTPDLTEQAFELFTQANRTPDRTQGGLGIGLALVKSLTELHHGTVVATSGGPGAGSTFTVTLPRLRTQPWPHPPQTEAPLAQPAPSLRILVVDDNEDAAKMLAQFLEMAGHEVMVEFSARRGLDKALSQAPDVCLLDIGLPEINGLELAREIRAHPALKHTTLVAITGYGQEQDRKNTAAAGFDHHLVKPIDPVMLTRLLGQRGPAQPDANDRLAVSRRVDR